jgi:hypothetical protein
VDKLLMHDGELFVGGLYNTIGGIARPMLARLDPVTAAVSAWDADLDGEVYDVLVDGTQIYLGGNFVSVQNVARRGVAALDEGAPVAVEPTRPVGGRAVVRLGIPYPQPSRGRTTLAFELAEAAEVNGDVFDLAGRRVARPIERRMLAAGRHEVVVQAGALPPGTYFVRVTAGHEGAARRLVLVR